jgi:hypothetical protein
MIRHLSRRLERIEARLMPPAGPPPVQVRIIATATGEIIDRFLATDHGPERPWLNDSAQVMESDRKIRYRCPLTR